MYKVTRIKEFIICYNKTPRGRVEWVAQQCPLGPGLSTPLVHSVPCAGLLHWTTSGHRMAATEPATCAGDTIQRYKGDIFQANTPSVKAYSCVSIDQNRITYSFLWNLLLAEHTGSWLTSWDSPLRFWTGDWPEEGNQCRSSREVGDVSLEGVVSCDEEGKRAMAGCLAANCLWGRGQVASTLWTSSLAWKMGVVLGVLD